MRALLAACGAVSGFLIALTLMNELSRELVWFESERRNFLTFVVLPTTFAMAVAVRALGGRLTSRPAWLAPALLGLGSLTLAASGTWGIRAASDHVAVGAWGSFANLEVVQAWEVDYQNRYWNAAAATARQEAWVQQSVASVTSGALPPFVEELRRARDPRRYQPTRPPDEVSLNVQRLRAGPFSSDDIYVGQLRARWRGVALEMPMVSGVPSVGLRTVEVREVLQWLGPAHEPDNWGWRLVRSEAEIR